MGRLQTAASLVLWRLDWWVSSDRSIGEFIFSVFSRGRRLRRSRTALADFLSASRRAHEHIPVSTLPPLVLCHMVVR